MQDRSCHLMTMENYPLLPSDDDVGLVKLPSDDCDDGRASSSQGKRRRLWTAQALRGPRGDHPRDVIPGPSAGDSLAAGNIDLPEEVANDELDDLLEDVTTATPKKEDVATDELDDLFVDVKTASPKKEDRSLAKTLGKKEARSCVPWAHRCRYPGQSGARACS